MTVAEIIQSLEARLARALKAKRRHKRRAKAYRDGLVRVSEMPADTIYSLIWEALEAIDEGDKTK